MLSEQILTYDEVETILAENDCDTQASEFEGMICGLFAGGMNNDQKSWKSPAMAHLNEGKLFPSHDMDTSDGYVTAIGKQLENDIFELVLSLPDDQATIAERLTGACQWSEGFLLGYGMAVGDQTFDSEDLNEAVADLLEVSQVELEVEDSEEMEQALDIVIEHIRVTSQVIYLETRTIISTAMTEQANRADALH
ncbi:MAG: UPF0149 family protein [Kangiellaceae bacterium]|jgi:uncharacterized protein YgfB (UPF0149 family)|nr:UPF0149 family protein [Kangiellaceae bacterium]